MRRSFLLLFPLLLALAPASDAADDAYVKAAKSIGDYLVKAARRDGEGLYWAQYEGPGPGAHGEELHFPLSFYSGLTGTGFFLLNLYHGTGDKKYLEAAKGAGLRLVSKAESLPGGAVKWSATSHRLRARLSQLKSRGSPSLSERPWPRAS